MSKLATEAELVKLGRMLELEPRALGFLGEVPAEQLRELRIAVHERVFQQDRVAFGRLAAVATRLPTRLSLMLADRTGPVLAARVTAEMPAKRAAHVAARVSTGFAADVCLHLDPRRGRDLIRLLPVERIVDMARELVARGDFVTMSRFVDYLPDRRSARWKRRSRTRRRCCASPSTSGPRTASTISSAPFLASASRR